MNHRLELFNDLIEAIDSDEDPLQLEIPEIREKERIEEEKRRIERQKEEEKRRADRQKEEAEKRANMQLVLVNQKCTRHANEAVCAFYDCPGVKSHDNQWNRFQEDDDLYRDYYCV